VSSAKRGCTQKSYPTSRGSCGRLGRYWFSPSVKRNVGGRRFEVDEPKIGTGDADTDSMVGQLPAHHQARLVGPGDDRMIGLRCSLSAASWPAGRDVSCQPRTAQKTTEPGSPGSVASIRNHREQQTPRALARIIHEAWLAVRTLLLGNQVWEVSSKALCWVVECQL
jgi:hypothetical protein